MTQSLSTDSFLDAFRRFIGRRGKPSQVLSDNTGCFVGADRVLRESVAAWNQAAINEHFRQRGIQWVFNPPLASQFGGCYERIIRSIRKILNVLLRDQLVSYEKLNTFMIEVESILNSRPLVPISMDPTGEAPLTPNHLLLLRNSLNVSPRNIFTGRQLHSQTMAPHPVFDRPILGSVDPRIHTFPIFANTLNPRIHFPISVDPRIHFLFHYSQE